MAEITIYCHDAVEQIEADEFGYFNATGLHLKYGLLYVTKEEGEEQGIAHFDEVQRRWQLFRDNRFYSDLEVIVHG